MRSNNTFCGKGEGQRGGDAGDKAGGHGGGGGGGKSILVKYRGGAEVGGARRGEDDGAGNRQEVL